MDRSPFRLGWRPSKTHRFRWFHNDQATKGICSSDSMHRKKSQPHMLRVEFFRNWFMLLQWCGAHIKPWSIPFTHRILIFYLQLLSVHSVQGAGFIFLFAMNRCKDMHRLSLSPPSMLRYTPVVNSIHTASTQAHASLFLLHWRNPKIMIEFSPFLTWPLTLLLTLCHHSSNEGSSN